MRVVEIAEDPAFGRTGHDAGGVQTLIDAVNAEITFHHDAFGVILLALLKGSLALRIVSLLILVEGARAIRTSFHAAPATDAKVVVDQHNAVVPLRRGAGGTDLHARRIAAMVTEHRQKNSARGGILPHLLLQHLAKEDPRWRRVLSLAGHGASVAANADIEINAHSVASHWRPPSFILFKVPGSRFNVPPLPFSLNFEP